MTAANPLHSSFAALQANHSYSLKKQNFIKRFALLSIMAFAFIFNGCQEDEEAEDQYGFFGSLFPGESMAGSYTFKVLNSLEYHVIEYNGEFFSDDLKDETLKWGVHDL